MRCVLVLDAFDKIKKTVKNGLFGRSGGIFGTAEYIPTLRLANELADLRVGYANPIRALAKCEQISVTNQVLT